MKSCIVVSFLFGTCVLCLSEAVEKLYPRVVTPLGNIEGFYNISYSGRKYEAYKGIRYAHPPTGELRFQVAKSISPWTGVLMAKQFGSPCMQYNFLLRDPANKVSGSEDCLYLNIYTPIAVDYNKTEANGTLAADLLPVIFFISGGGFIIGNGDGYGPQYLLDRNVVLVTFNYRLGPLGFLSTEDEIVPGNMGLKDQVIALRWVKDNIQSFRGDPSRISIIGQSTGGVCAHFHYLTNLTAGLFQRGMSQSGTALNVWNIVKDPLKNAKKLARIVGCSTENILSMVDCLRTKPAHQIVDAVGEFMNLVYHPPSGWGPSVEKRGGEFTFIDRLPIDIISSGDAHDVPWITGVVSEEGLFPTSYYIANEEVFGLLDTEWEKIAPHILYYNDIVPHTDQPRVSNLIKHHYFGESPISRATFNQTVRLMSDRVFIYGTESAARIQAQTNRSPVYVYYFSYRGAHSFSESMSGTSENFGVSHSDDKGYVLYSFFDPTTTAKDREMQRILVDFWVSYVINGTPDVGVEWPRLSNSSTDEFRYLHIAGPREIGMKSASNFGNKNFWQSIGFQESIL